MHIGHRDLWKGSAPPSCKGCMRETGTHYTCLDRHLIKRRKGEQKVAAQHKGCCRADAQVPCVKPVNVYTRYPLSVY